MSPECMRGGNIRINGTLFVPADSRLRPSATLIIQSITHVTTLRWRSCSSPNQLLMLNDKQRMEEIWFIFMCCHTRNSLKTEPSSGLLSTDREIPVERRGSDYPVTGSTDALQCDSGLQISSICPHIFTAFTIYLNLKWIWICVFYDKQTNISNPFTGNLLVTPKFPNS